jgi:hypothetical protein
LRVGIWLQIRCRTKSVCNRTLCFLSYLQTPITLGWVNLFALRFPGEIIHTKSVPREEQWLQGRQGRPESDWSLEIARTIMLDFLSHK